MGLGSLLSVDGYLYAGSSSGVYCFNAQNGAVIWVFAADEYASSSQPPSHLRRRHNLLRMEWPLIFLKQHTQHSFFALEAASGKKLWNYTLGTTITAQPVIENGTVYVSGSFVTTQSPRLRKLRRPVCLKTAVSTLPLPSPQQPHPHRHPRFQSFQRGRFCPWRWQLPYR